MVSSIAIALGMVTAFDDVPIGLNPMSGMTSKIHQVRRMGLSKFDADQVKRAFTLLQSSGIEPTAETIQALVETAEAHYPNDPNSLEKATQSMVEFFTGSPAAREKDERPWERLWQWAFSVLRI